jgi:hypothetical protein
MDDHDADAQTLASRVSPSAPVQDSPGGKSRAFYMSFLAIMVATLLSALDLTAVGTALPTIANALNDTKGDYIWVFGLVEFYFEQKLTQLYVSRWARRMHLAVRLLFPSAEVSRMHLEGKLIISFQPDSF